MTLITLDYDIDRSRDPLDIHIVLHPLEKDATNKLIQLAVPGLPDIARERIAVFSEGYPRIAVLLSENFSFSPNIFSPDTLSKLGISDLLDRTVAGRYREMTAISKVKQLLTMIALFRRVGWDDDVAIQGEKLCELFHINWMEARQIVMEQEARGLIIKRGRYRYVTPLPLAVHLASSWWAAMGESQWLKIFEELPDLETRKAFLERLKDMPTSDQARNALKSVLSGFGYEVLDSSSGSAIFLALTKGDHLAAMETLERILGNLPRERLLEFRTGRRNTVWALGKIAWWQDTFRRAASLLLKLADAENEAWSNNATGIFAQLFQTYLGATAVPAWERHSILEEALDSGNQSLQKIALKGLAAAFSLGHAMRSMDAEEQGTVVLPPEWNPRTREDLSTSISSALKVLDKAMRLPDSEVRIEAAQVFLSEVRTLLAHGFKDEVIERLQFVRANFPELEKGIIKTVEGVIYYDSKRLPAAVINSVRSFRDELVGGNFEDLMKRYVKSSLLEDQLKENQEKVEKAIRELVDETTRFPEKLKAELKWLVTNEAENGYVFGQILGESDKEYYWLDIILHALKESEDPSVNFLGGYLSSIRVRNEDLWERTLHMCRGDQILRKFTTEIIWRSGKGDRAARLIIEMLKGQEIGPQELRLFIYGAWFNKVSAKVFVEFLEEYYKIEEGKHAPAALGIIGQYADAHPDIVVDARDILMRYLTRPEVFASEQDRMILYYWDALSDAVMKRFDDTIPHFLDLLLRVLENRSDLYLEPYLRKKFEYFLQKDPENTWTKIGKALLAHDLRAWRLLHLMKGDYSQFRHEKTSLLDLVPEAQLWEWVEGNAPKTAYILARMIPLHESEPLFHPLARKLLMKFPNDENIASELSSNWHTEGWSGSESLHYEAKYAVAHKWARDPEASVAKWANEEMRSLKEQIDKARRREEESE